METDIVPDRPRTKCCFHRKIFFRFDDILKFLFLFIMATNPFTPN